MINIYKKKYQYLKKLSDNNGIFKILAIDQRGSLKKLLNTTDSKIIKNFKKLIVENLFDLVTGILIDPEYGLEIIKNFSNKVSFLISYEKTGYKTKNMFRKTELLEDNLVIKAIKAGALGIKLLIYYNPFVEKDIKQYQQNIVRYVGEKCFDYNMPFFLEILGYPHTKKLLNNREYAKIKPVIIFESVKEFSKSKYKVDILKLEFPADIKYIDYLYSIEKIIKYVRDISSICRKPWVLLSAGVDIQLFLKELKIAVNNGASGFLAGRAIWKQAANFETNNDLRQILEKKVRENLRKSIEIANNATCWYNFYKL